MNKIQILKDGTYPILCIMVCGSLWAYHILLVDTILKKLDININGDEKCRVLDLGCGWGKIANYVSTVFNCNVDGITLSDRQYEFASQHSLFMVNIMRKHYLDLDDKYDYIYSIGMFEHVTYKNYDSFFKCIKKILKPNGKFLLHTIISTEKTDPKYIDKTFVSEHIFPESQIPNNDWITDSITKNGLSLVHSEFFGGQHYANTLNEWYGNLQKNKDELITLYGIKLYLTYEYYFNICIAGFKCGQMGICHYLISNSNVNSLDNSFVH